MNKKKLRELLRECLHVELQLFKDSVFQREKEDIRIYVCSELKNISEMGNP